MTMMRQALIITAVFAFLLTGCAKKAEVPQATSPEAMASAAAQANSQMATPAGAKVLKVTLSPMKGSKISGTATFTQSEAEETRIQVAVTGAGSTGQLSAQLRGGTCAKPGQIDVADTWQLSGGTAEGPVLAASTFDSLTAKPTIVVIIPVVAAAGSPAILSCGQTKQ
jgi:hypothetical protein